LRVCRRCARKSGGENRRDDEASGAGGHT
jgi:hypothetical protein